MSLNKMSAVFAAAAIRGGKITSEELVRACLDRIVETEETVRAWTYLDREYAVKQAQDADIKLRSGKEVGPLHGLPVGIKDIFDTADMPTENGTILHAGRQPGEDATAVSLLREAGAIIMGKTVTTELAVYAPGKTTNPYDSRRTPGGSSSGSAAAVAAFMVPLAIGTQTNGSVIRPASYCGVYGYKPTHGRISRHGVLSQSRVLDQVGVFARSIEDAALIAQQLMAFDNKDPDVKPKGRFDLNEALMGGPPIRPRLAFVKSPVWGLASDITQDAFARMAAQLSENVKEVKLPNVFERAIDWHRTIMESDLAKSFEVEYISGRDKMSPILCEMIARGQTYSAVDYNKAVEAISTLNNELGKIFSAYDAILTPATSGEAPIGLDSTGSPIFCTLWTLCGVPSINLPILKGAENMPMGVQLVAPRGDDYRLLRIAKWLVNEVPFKS
ncbi:MAG: amidase [Desulfobacterales bacterium]|nr:amidase [Desulfobacterales bacterium]